MSEALDATSQQTFTANTTDGPIVGSVQGAQGVQGTGTPLLLLHGGPAMSDYMEMLGPELAGWRAVKYQQRGLAPSAVGGPFTVERHVADAVAVLDELGIDQAVVLGHSWGGYLALNLALAHPERVTGLVIIDPLGAVDDGGLVEMGQNLGSRLLPSALDQYAEVAARLATPEPTDDDMLESLRLLWPGYFADPQAAPALPSFMRASVGAYAGTFASVAELQASGLGERLGGIEAPAVFVLGEKSPMPVSQGEATAALLSRAEVRVVPEAGHLPWHEQPGCVAAALARVGELTGVS
jgi:proline iminopeptidase